MTKTTSQPHLDAIRLQLLPLVLEDAGFDGWNDKVLARAAKNAGLHPGQVELALPQGAVDLIRFWARRNDQIMLDRWQLAEGPKMRVRDKAVFLVRSRIEAVGEPHREAAARAKSLLVRPDHAADAIAMAWESSDAMWRAMGDVSTDINYYSKRVILATVFTSTFGVWLRGDVDKTWAFLDRRIANVMQFEQFKGQVRKKANRLPDPLKIMAKLRYGTGRTRPRRM